MSMKLAGRKRSACNTMPSASRPGRSSFNAASTALVTATVLAPYCADTLIITPSWPSIAAPPMGGSGASTTSATFPSVTLAAPWLSSTVRAARCCQDIVQAQVIPDDLVRVDLDLDGATVAAKGHHLCDARDGEQSRTHCPVSNCAQLH